MPPADVPTVPVDRSARRGPVPLPAAEKRGHCVSVRLNRRELERLDTLRGRFQRGEWLRMAALDRLPPTVPEVNVQAWADLAGLAANLSQAQAAIKRGDAGCHQLEILEALCQAVAALRNGLVCVQT